MVEVSISIASKLYQKGSYQAKNIRIQAKYWIENGLLPISKQGCHKKTKSLINNEDLIDSNLRFICQSSGKTIPKDYQQFIQSMLFNITNEKKIISLKTS